MKEKNYKKERFKIIRVEPNYIKYLRKYDNKVQMNDELLKKDTKPFIGIVFNINNCDYFVPISSYTADKTKYLKMFNHYKETGFKSLDMVFIEDNKKKLLAVLNLNNMIPIAENSKIDFNINLDKDKSLLIKELKYCNNNKEEIIRSCNRIYNAVIHNEGSKLIERCCNFSLLEEKCKEWEKLKEIEKNKDKQVEEILEVITEEPEDEDDEDFDM